MPITITFIRHAETMANAEHRWQGASDAPLSDRGRDQVRRLGERFADDGLGRLVSSDLPRTVTTAGAIGTPALDPMWREFDVGAWEGLTTEEVEAQDPERFRAMRAGEDVALGGGERMSDFRLRISEAFDRLVETMDDGDAATVVTHGGVIWAVIDRIVGRDGVRASVGLAANTSVTRVRVDEEGRTSLITFNDSTHLDEVPTRPGFENRTMTLVRHGQTVGNQRGRWQGRSDSPLTDEGRWQVAETARVLHVPDAMYTSPLGRATASAGIIGDAVGLEPEPRDGLIEMSFGSWEDLTPAEAAVRDPELFEAIYEHSEDRPRGGDGETFTGAGLRMATTVSGLSNGHRPSNLAAVSHGAVIRAFVSDILGLTFADRHRLPVPRNSAMSRISYFDDEPYLASYNVAPHLD